MNKQEETKRIKKKKKTRKIIKLPKIIFLMVLLWFFGNAMYSFVLSSLVQTEFVTLGYMEKKHQTNAFLIKNEKVIRAPSSGAIKNMFPEGEKIAKNDELFAIRTVDENNQETKGEVSIKAPVSGIVSYNVDGLEYDFSVDRLNQIEIENLEKFKVKNNDTTENDQVKKDNEVCKIIDNLKGLKCFIKLPLDILEKPVEIGQQLKIGFPQYDLEINVSIIDFKKDKVNAQILVKFPQMCYSLMNERVVEAEIITKRKQGIILPLKAIVTNENGEKGVLWKNKGTVLWRPIEIIEKNESEVLIQGINPLTEVIITPKWVKKGQYIY